MCWRGLCTAALIQGLMPLTVGLASPALACPVCGFGQDGAAYAYLMTAVLMSSIPLIKVGAILYYLIRRTSHAPDEANDTHH